jgi:hypothetical protein
MIPGNKLSGALISLPKIVPAIALSTTICSWNHQLTKKKRT